MKAREEKYGENRRFYLFLVLTLGAAFLLVGALHDRTLPLAEGWYTYYARCINEGLLPYRDFEYLYPPVYIYTVAFFTRVFGYELIVLRRLGILFFLLITVGLYLVGVEVVGKRRCAVAGVAAVCSAYYLQSEVVQIFYDYVRFMDIFSIFSLYFLLKAAKGLVLGAPYRKHLFWCGLFCGTLVNIKQNIGLIFLAFAIALLFYLGAWCRRPAKAALADILFLTLPFALVCLAVIGALAACGSLGGYFSMTGAAAAGAKGGFGAILFGWLPNNSGAFLAALPAALLFISLTVGAFLWLQHRRGNAWLCKEGRREPFVLGIAFFAILFALLAAIILSPKLGTFLAPRYNLSTYTVFLTVAPLFAALGVLGIADMVKKTEKLAPFIPFFVLSGGYVAISFACGNSGGLAEGQAPFGILFLILASFSLIQHALHHTDGERCLNPCFLAARGGVLLLCLTLALQSTGKKLLYTYNWWGMTEGSYWESTEALSHPLLQGISVTPSGAAAIEGIVTAITENTSEGEPIFCFPQIPLFYVLTDRPDPGTFTKVQWFDVASDRAMLGDIEIIRQDPPGAILIYHTSEYAYDAHEAAFRGGNVSGTRQMRDFLLTFVKERGYRHHATYLTGNNTLTLWLAP